MHGFFSLFLILMIASGGFFLAKWRVISLAERQKNLRSSALPSYYGWCSFLWCALAGAAAYTLASLLHLPIMAGSGLPAVKIFFPPGIALLALVAAYFMLSPHFRARHHMEKCAYGLLIAASLISITITILIVLSVLVESLRFFAQVNVLDFLFGIKWSPQTALRPDQGGASGSFGAVPVFLGTLLITLIAMAIAIPAGLFAAIYLSEYASRRFRTLIKPVLEMLAGIPTVVYGYFAALTVGPLLRHMGESIGISVASESALAAGLVMGIMIIPFVLSLSDDVMHAVPLSMREASLALGATRSETILRVVVPSALPGIMGAILLAISRAIGETMIVVMAAGLAANLTFNPLSSVTTVTAQIVTLLVGDQEFDSPKTLAAFALGLVLFIITLVLNIAALMIVKRYRERYE